MESYHLKILRVSIVTRYFYNYLIAGNNKILMRLSCLELSQQANSMDYEELAYHKDK